MSSFYEVKFKEMSTSSFSSLSAKDNGTLYVVKDGSKRWLYKGDNLIAKNYDEGVSIIRSRSKSSGLTSVGAGDTVGSISCTQSLNQGDRLLVELSDYNGASYNLQIVGITVGRSTSSPNSTDDDTIASWTTWNGTNRVTYAFSFSYSGSTLYFGSKKRLIENFSGTTISITTSTYTLYVGQIWRLSD